MKNPKMQQMRQREKLISQGQEDPWVSSSILSPIQSGDLKTKLSDHKTVREEAETFTQPARSMGEGLSPSQVLGQTQCDAVHRTGRQAFGDTLGILRGLATEEGWAGKQYPS